MNGAVRTFAEFEGRPAFRQRLRGLARDTAVWLLSLAASPASGTNWIRFPYYHHVLDDERAGFDRQLRWMRRFGEFIGWEEAVALLASGQPVDGRYFCLSFDDGFKSCRTNALPILVERGALGTAFFLPTAYMDTDVGRDRELLLGFYDHRRTLMEFMSWDDARDLAAAGMVVGSHSHGHANLARLDAAAAAAELARSKTILEEKMGAPCLHFGCPFGRPGIDFIPDRDPALAHQAGYASFATTARGAMRAGDSPLFIRRDHTLAGWGDYQLRWFLSR